MRFCFFGWSIQNNKLVMIFIHCFIVSKVPVFEQRRNKDKKQKNQKNTKKQNSKRKNGEKGEMRV